MSGGLQQQQQEQRVPERADTELRLPVALVFGSSSSAPGQGSQEAAAPPAPAARDGVPDGHIGWEMQHLQLPQLPGGELMDNLSWGAAFLPQSD